MNNRTGHSTVTLLTTIAKGVKFVEPQQFAKDFDNSMTVGASISVVQIGQIADPALTLNLNQVSGRDIDEPTIRTLSGVIIDPYNSDVVHLPLSTNLLIGLLTQISSLSGRDLVQAATNLNDAFYYLAATTSSRQAHFGKAGSVLGDVRWIGFDKDKETGVKLKVSKKPIKGGIEVMTTDVV